MQSNTIDYSEFRKECSICNEYFYKLPNESQKYWNKKKYCSIQCTWVSKIWFTTASKTHWMRHTRIYNTWWKMKARCDNINDKSYLNYGWRWITYCDSWKSFDTFYDDMKEWYDDSLSIDRIDVNWNYCKENCRWANTYQQSINKRNSRYLTLNGITKTLSEWSKELWIWHSTILRRIWLWWSIYDALTKPLTK
jgi:hypothetical protein